VVDRPRPATLEQLPTPAAVIDLARVQRNTAHMAARARRLGVRLRPHVKTHKCVAVARLQVADHFGGITVSTLAEAEHFAAAGFDDIIFAVPIAPGRVPRAVALAARIGRLTLLVDDDVAIDALEAAATHGAISVCLKVDCGYHRAGVDPTSEAALGLARRLHAAPNLVFAGILAHAGHSYDCVGADAIRAVAEEERAVTVGFAERLRAAGVPVGEVSVGSTPTSMLADDLTGVTEIRPGNYALFDVFQASIGSCTADDIALSVVTEIMGAYPDRGSLLVDAGALALSKDPGPRHVRVDGGFGLVCDLAGTPLPGFTLVGLCQEHGKIRLSPGTPLHGLRVGDRLRIMPNHSCLVTALHARLYVAEGRRIVDEWRPVRGW
jgi:D-serine deaminase-like pyridoxal phosphate-dependent protein